MYCWSYSLEALILATIVYTALFAWNDFLSKLVARTLFASLPEDSVVNWLLQAILFSVLAIAFVAFVNRNIGDILGIDYLIVKTSCNRSRDNTE